MTEPAKYANLVEALAAAQGSFTPIIKDKKAEAGARGSYRYSDLSDILAVVRPGLSKVNIAITQSFEPMESGGLMLHTQLHGYGETLESSMPIPGMGGMPQAFGSAASYARKYSLAALVGVAAEDDDDDGAAAGKKPVTKPSRDQSGTSREPDERPRTPPDDAWLAEAGDKVAKLSPDELKSWWNSEIQKRQRADLHKRRADLEPAMDELKAIVARRWWECSNLEIPPNGMGWQKWQGLMARTIDAAPTLAKLEQLLRDNYAHTQALGLEVPRAADALAAKIENARLLLADHEAPLDLGDNEEGDG